MKLFFQISTYFPRYVFTENQEACSQTLYHLPKVDTKIGQKYSFPNLIKVSNKSYSNFDHVLSYFSRYLAFCPTANIECTYYCSITGITGTRSKPERIVWKSSFFWTTLKSSIYNVCKTSLFNDWKTFGFLDNVTSLEIKSNAFKIQSPAYFSENFYR